MLPLRQLPLPAAALATNPMDSSLELAHTLAPATAAVSSSPPENPSSSRPESGAEANRPTDDFASFFEKTFAPLRRYVARLVGSRDEAQDIAQDAYARVFTVMRDRTVDHPQALLYTTARHLAIDELKHRRRSPFDEAATESAPSAAPGIEAIVMAREEAAMLERAIGCLPEDCRRVLLLRTGEHLTYDEVAQRLGFTRKQAEKRMHRAVRLLHLEMNAPHAPTAVPSDLFPKKR